MVLLLQKASPESGDVLELTDQCGDLLEELGLADPTAVDPSEGSVPILSASSERGAAPGAGSVPSCRPDRWAGPPVQLLDLWRAGSHGADMQRSEVQTCSGAS